MVELKPPRKKPANAQGHKCFICGAKSVQFDSHNNSWVCGHHSSRNYLGEDKPHKSEGNESLDGFS